jgi:hypothetical protein
VESLFNTILALKERGLLPDTVLRALVRIMCAQWVRTFECGGDVEKQASYNARSEATNTHLRALTKCA